MTAASLDLAALADALPWVAKAIPKRTNVPVLGGVKITADSDGRVVLSGYDYEVGHTATLDAIVTDPGTVLVSGYQLAAMAATLKGDTVRLSTDDNETHLEVVAGRTTFRLPTMKLGEYPNLPEPPPTVGVASADDLDDLVRSVLWGCGTDDTVAVLMGIHLVADGDGIQGWASNRFVAAMARANWACATPFDVVVLGRHLAGALAGMAGRLEVGVSKTQFRISSSTRTVTTRLLDDAFPKLAPLYPKRDAWTTTAEVDVADLKDALRRAQVALEVNQAAWLDLTSDGIEVHADPEPGHSATAREPVDGAVTGDPLTVGFNPRLLAGALDSIHTTTVVLGFAGPTRPAVVIPAGTDTYDPLDADVAAMVMPRRRK